MTTPVSHPDREQQIIAAFVTLADTLVDDYDIIDLLNRLVGHVVALLAADAAGLLLGDAQSQLRVAAASSEDAQTTALLQLHADEGPCLEAYRTGTQVRVPELADVGHRWPVFVAAVQRAGAFRSVHTVPLRLRGHTIGAMSLLHHRPGALPEPDLALGQALADVATIGILSERAVRRGEVVNEQLQTALHSRVIIEQAKGVVAQHLGVTMDVAFDRLRRYARSRNMRMSEVARQAVDGDLDTAALVAEQTVARPPSTRPRGRHRR